jgi:hypothetical protein
MNNKRIPKFKGIKSYEKVINYKNIDSFNSKKKELDNEKRLQTLKQKLNQQKAQQLLVKESINSNKTINKRIVFDLDHNKQQLNNNIESLTKSKQLFENDSNDSEVEENEFEFNLNKKISDKNAEKLIQLNSRFAHDIRFKIDNRFLDFDNNNNNNEEVLNEKDKNLHLLEEVLGTKIKPIIKREDKTNDNNDSKNSELFVSRFDPTNEKSFIYEVSNSVNKKKVTFDNKVLAKKEVIVKEEKVENVSQELYYEVSSALKESLNNKDNEFSLTQMFGNENNVKKRNFGNELNPKSEEIVYKKSNKSLNSLPNPFKYDSSSSDEEEDEKIVISTNDNKPNRMSESYQKFFFVENDPRFEEDIFYRKDLVEKAKNNWKERQFMFIKAMGLRKRSAKKNIKSDQKRNKKFNSFKRFKSS